VQLLYLLFTASAHDAGAESGTGALSSVGRLQVPAQRFSEGYARHYDERCSATLVSTDPRAVRSDLILSAWHCLEDYRDLSRPVVFEAASGHRVQARLLASGGGMHSDWALLRLATPLARPAHLGSEYEYAGRSLMMAGYPLQSLNAEKQLTTASGCRVTGVAGHDLRSDCVLQKGASGGGVFSATAGGAYLGVISRGDGASQSIFVPASRFHARVLRFFPELLR